MFGIGAYLIGCPAFAQAPQMLDLVTIYTLFTVGLTPTSLPVNMEVNAGRILGIFSMSTSDRHICLAVSDRGSYLKPWKRSTGTQEELH